MPTKFELLAAKMELEYRLDQERKKIRNAAVNDAADAALPEGAELFSPSKDIKKLQAEAKANAKAFLDAHPEIDPENWGTLIEWMKRKKLSPTTNNFQVAYELLQKSGALVEPEITEELIENMTSEEFRERLTRDSKFREAVERFK